MDEKKRSGNAVFLLIVLASFLLMGAEGCPQSTTTTQTGPEYQSTSASSQGLDFSLIPGVGMFTEGSKINVGDTFRVGIHIENYGKQPRSGEVCINDDIDNSYGGIESACAPFSVREADYQDDKVIKSGQTDVYFPSGNEYSYTDFLSNQNTKLFTLPAKLLVNLKYSQISSMQGSVPVPIPETETISLNQDPEAVSVSVQKTVSSREGNYKADLGITFDKKVSTSEVYDSNFKNKGLTFNVKLGNYPVDCGMTSNFIEMENTKFIRCFALLPKEQITHPLLIDLNYGVKLNKEFSFTIQKEAKV